MRVDLVLKYLCLMKSRAQAAAACSGGRVLLNGVAARASATVRPGDRITLLHASGGRSIILDEVPIRQQSRSGAESLYHTTLPPPGEVPEPIDPLNP